MNDDSYSMIEGQEWAYDDEGDVKESVVEQFHEAIKTRPLTQVEAALLFAYIDQLKRFIEVLSDYDD